MGKIKSGCEHKKFYASYILSSYPLKHPWTCGRCGAQGIDIGYNVKHLNYEELIQYFPNMNK